MCAIGTVKKLIDDTSSLVSYVKNSGLRTKCEPKLKKYVPTRWNTVCDMFHAVNVNYVKLSQILLQKEEADQNANVMDKLTAVSRMHLQNIHDFLKQFKDWTKHLESEKKATLWMIWPIFIHLNKYLIELPSDSDIVKVMKQAGRDYLDKNLVDIQPQILHKISTVLNPLLKNIAMASSEDRKNVYNDINYRISQFMSSETDDNCATEPLELADQEMLNDFMGFVDAETEFQPNSDVYKEEFQRYLNIKIKMMNPYDFDLITWWFGNRTSFPNLYRLFLSLAGITAASSPSERSFSETGIIITAQRSNLLPETVHDLVLARNKYLNFL